MLINFLEQQQSDLSKKTVFIGKVLKQDSVRRRFFTLSTTWKFSGKTVFVFERERKKRIKTKLRGNCCEIKKRKKRKKNETLQGMLL